MSCRLEGEGDQETDAPGAQFATGDRDPRAWHNATAAFPNHSAKWKAYAAVQHSVAAGVWAAGGADAPPVSQRLKPSADGRALHDGSER